MKIDDLHIWCLNLIDAIERHDVMLNEFDKIGIKDKVQFYYNTNLPIYNLFGQIIPTFQTNWYQQLNNICEQLYGRVLSCAIGWYNIMKISYIKGYEYIMCFEDDVQININEDEFKDILNKIPEDFDVVKLLYPASNYGNEIISPDKINDVLPKYNINDQNIFDSYEMLKCNAWFIINRKTMKIWIDVMENYKTFTFADGVIENKNLKFYNIRYRVGQLFNIDSLITKIKPNINVKVK